MFPIISHSVDKKRMDMYYVVRCVWGFSNSSGSFSDSFTTLRFEC